jgi:hypothetical protein
VIAQCDVFLRWFKLETVDAAGLDGVHVSRNLTRPCERAIYEIGAR